ncbi:hypothetical protein FG93_00688 [Bosea sp. LC85]|uniref:hypothetical protein n=1 Tax=Bosea sp. LC85 TaxID=1502851 RepID=UPI0004E29C2C|nr:hypothetical protein [Bosea sp. LC85]KFC75666.1 hypothetical protein FG93_00688 [Bosea sp. LC85]
MHHTANAHSTPFRTTSLDPLHEPETVTTAGECPFLGRVTRVSRALVTSLALAFGAQRGQSQNVAMDAHTLNDIGLTQAEAAQWGPLNRHMPRPWGQTDTLN